MQKYFVFLSTFLVVIFSACLVFGFNKINYAYNFNLNSFNQTENNVNDSNFIYNTLTQSKNESLNLEKPIFKNSVEAIVSATKNLNTRENFYMKSIGTVITKAGLTVEVASEQEVWKFNNNHMFEILEKFQTKGINMGQTSATNTYINNNKTYKQETNSVYQTNSCLTSDFSNKSWTQVNNQSTTLLHYIFSSKTILNPTELIIKHNNEGKILSYSAEFNLHPNLSTTKYATIIKDNSGGKAKDLPSFQTVKMRIEIDSLGQLLSLYCFEIYTMNVGITATLTNTFYYEFKGLDSAPQISIPTLP